MEKLEKIELIREKCNVGYEEARDALEACNYDVLEALIMLERAHKTTARRAEPVEGVYEATAEAEPAAAYAYEPVDEATYEAPRAAKAAGAWRTFCEKCRTFARASMDTAFIIERNGELILSIPVLFVILGIFIWGATLWLLIIGLFFGFRYRMEGSGRLVSDVNGVMGGAADIADDIKERIA